ncbi:MAG: TraR/DksA C4-type zinc finger protein [Candidatus Cloacimonadota bacterium]|nr:TraR/DksA C4-type zinc finger protein [Candidatus Cloacimonadota bacterium]
MTENDLNHYKEILLNDRQRIVKSIEDIDRSLSKSIRDSAGDISAYSTHLADLGSDSDEREKETHILERELINLKRVDRALKMIFTKTYGICTYCGKQISDKRLKAVPYTDLCIDCKRKEEGFQNHNVR